MEQFDDLINFDKERYQSQISIINKREKDKQERK